MHRCLEIEDIVIMIIRHLVNEVTSSQGHIGYHGGSVHANIAALAVTCRALYKLGVNALWEEMNVTDFLQAVSYNFRFPFSLFTLLRR